MKKLCFINVHSNLLNRQIEFYVSTIVFLFCTDLFIDEIWEGRIAHEEPPPRRDSVGLVLELFRPKFEEVLEQVRLQQVGVDAGNAVHSVRSNHGLNKNKKKHVELWTHI